MQLMFHKITLKKIGKMASLKCMKKYVIIYLSELDNSLSGG